MTSGARRLAFAFCALAMIGAPRADQPPAATSAATEAAAPKREFTPAELDETIARLDDERRRAGSDELRDAIERRLGNALVLRARAHAKAGDNEAAMDTYDRALAVVPEHPQALVELGWLQLGAGHPEQARHLAERLLVREPDNGYALELRGEVLYRDDRLQDALSDFRGAAAKRPADAALAKKIAKVERELNAERDYSRADSSHFVLRFDGERDDRISAVLLDVLEREVTDLEREISTGSNGPITVILYTNRTFHETTGTGNEVIGLFDGKVRLPVGGITSVTPGLVRVVRHELTHALLHVRGRGNVPRWLHEGFAQVMEPRDRKRGDAETRGELKGAPASLEPFSYPRALSFVAWLEQQFGRTRVLWFVDLLGQRQDEDDALRRAFGLSRDELMDGWNRWLSSQK